MEQALDRFPILREKASAQASTLFVRPSPSGLIVFDVIVKPDQTGLLSAALAQGCVIVRGRDMMRGQIARMAEFF